MSQSSSPATSSIPSASGAPSHQPNASVEPVAERVAARRDEIAATMAVQIACGIGAYRDASAPQLLAEVEANCATHFDAFVRSLRIGHPPLGDEGNFIDAAILDRVRQEIPLDELLHAFRVGQKVLWAEVVSEAGPMTDVAVALAGPTMEYVDVVSTRVAQVYLGEVRRLEINRERENRDLVEHLLREQHLKPAEAKRMQGLGLSGNVLVAVLQSADLSPSGGDRLGPAILREAAADGIGVLVAPLQGSLTVLLSLDKHPAPRVIAVLRRALATLGRCGVGVPAAAPGEIARGYREARAALERTSDTEPLVYLGGEGAFRYLVTMADPSVAALVSPRLRRVIADAVWLAETASAYLQENLSTQAAAERLFLHPNTLRYRLRRLEEQGGIDLKRFSDLVELCTALNLRRAGSSDESDVDEAPTGSDRGVREAPPKQVSESRG